MNCINETSILLLYNRIRDDESGANVYCPALAHFTA